MPGTQFSLFEIVRRRWPAFVFASVLMSLLVASGYLLQPLRYTVSGTYQPQKTEPQGNGVRNASDLLEQLKFLDQFLNQFFRSDNDITPEAKLIKDDEALQRTIQSLQITDHEGNPASPRSLRRRVRLSARAKGDAVNIAFDDSDPEQAQRIINQLMAIYIERFAPESQAEAVNFTTVLQPHLVNSKTLEKQAKQALYQIQLGTNQTPLAPVDKAGDQTLELQSIRISAQQQFSTVDSDIALLQQELNIATPDKKTLLQSMIELSTVRKTVLEQLYDVLNRSKDDPSLGTRLSTLENKTLDLQKNLVLTQNIYNSFLERQKTPWAFNSNRKNAVQIIRPATIPAQGTRPFFNWFLGLGTLASLGTGIIASVLIEGRDSTLLSLTDLYAQLKLPIFGIVPHFSGKALSVQNLARQDGTEFQEFASITDVYTQILRRFEIASLNRIPQVLAFTSTGPNEGKSLTVSNLAYSLSKTGKKILLIEADLFQPSQYQYWNTIQSVGLCDCIAGKVQLGKALQRLHPNLDLLQGGDTQKNKDILLNSPGITLLIKEFRSRYDHILLDTPALSDSVHGYLMANCADVTLLVTRPSRINKARIFNLKETIDRTDYRLWGMIINDAAQNPRAAKTRKLIKDSQWDATIRLQKQMMASTLEISTLSALNKQVDEASYSDEIEHERLNLLDLSEQSRRDKQEAYLYNLPLDELHKLVDALWESWSHNIEILLEQEEEVVQQSRLVRELQGKIKRGNPYLRLSSELQLKEEEEKLNLLADTYIGPRPTLIEDRDELQYYLEVLFARTDAEHIPIV